MKQQTTWTRYLLLGLIMIGVIISLSACDKAIDWEKYGEFYLVNKTSYKIAIIDPQSKFEIAPFETFHLKQVQPSKKQVLPEEYEDPITQEIGPRLEVIVKIGDKCSIQTKNSTNSIINIKNYVAERINKTTYKFTYTFTEADYHRAVACPN